MSTPVDYFAIFMQFLVAIGFVVVSMLVSHWAGPKRKTTDKLENFECGIDAVGNARMPFSIRYFMTAILFVMFDVEVVFMYPWAVNFRQLGMLGMIEMLLFAGLLLLGYVYILKKGALKWE
jgi:NADH-quinone oxidoreductase subunit A